MDRPIPFSAPMVRALLAGTKTQTRRVVKIDHTDSVFERLQGMLAHFFRLTSRVPVQAVRCPYGVPGDRLWVREAWRSGKIADRFPPRELTPHPVWYEADGQAPEATNGKLRPGMFMPRWASRITLEITGVRVERLQDISEADAIAEGVERGAADGFWKLYGRETNGDMDRSPRVAYRSLWESINGAGSWDANPFVWVVEFKRVA
jgi:hypothetical protein